LAGLVVCLLAALPAKAQSIVQLGLIIDASSSTDDELPTFRDGVADALATLKTDGTIELTLVQFSAEGKVIFGPAIMDNATVLQEAVSAARNLDPTFTDIPPINGGTNIEDAFLETLNALQNSANAGNASLQFVNMLSDGHPTSHNHLDFSDFNENVRHERGKSFAKTQRDALVAAGIDVISFEALGSSAADLDYLKTLTHPGAPAVVETDPATGQLAFPSPIDSQGFLLPIATVDGIGEALSAKFAAAGFAPTLDPDPLTTVDHVGLTPDRRIEFIWTGRQGFRYQVEYSEDMIEWLQDLPDSLITPAGNGESLSYSASTAEGPRLYYRIVEQPE
jgi:hypothetical protein